MIPGYPGYMGQMGFPPYQYSSVNPPAQGLYPNMLGVTPVGEVIQQQQQGQQNPQGQAPQGQQPPLSQSQGLAPMQGGLAQVQHNQVPPQVQQQQQQQQIPMQMQVMANAQDSLDDCACYLVGVAKEIDINGINTIFKKMFNDAKIEGKNVEPPLHIEWVNEKDMECLRVIFPNKESAKHLITNSLKINNCPIIVLPSPGPNKTVLDLLFQYEIFVQSNPPVDDIYSIHKLFAKYGDIMDIVPIREGQQVVIFSHKQSLLALQLPVNSNYIIDNQNVSLYVAVVSDKPIPVRRVSFKETLSHRLQHRSISNKSKFFMFIMDEL